MRTLCHLLKNLLQEDIELVVITTPNHLHYSMIKQSLLADKHVIVEKPFVTDSREGKELLALAKERGLHLSVFHNRRWDADFLTIQQLLKEADTWDRSLHTKHILTGIARPSRTGGRKIKLKGQASFMT